MPTINDAQVSAGYATIYNARPQVLANGWKVAAVWDQTNKIIYLQVDKGAGYVALCNIKNGTNLSGLVSLAHYGNIVYVAAVSSGSVNLYVVDATTQTNVQITSTTLGLEAAQNTFYGIDILVNGNDLLFAEASMNTNLPSNVNLRYSKSVIATNGTVTTGTVEQVTSINNASYVNVVYYPSLSIDKDGIPVIFVTGQIGFNDDGSTTYGSPDRMLHVFKRDRTLVHKGSLVHASWSAKKFYESVDRSQYYPNAIFIPADIAKKINASYTNGLHIVGWQGYDGTDTTAYNIRCMASSDGCQTFFNFGVANEKITAGNTYSQNFPSLTYNKLGEISIVWDGSQASKKIRTIKYSGGVWGAIVDYTSVMGGSKPIAIIDPTIIYTTPLFIYTDTFNGRVGFYGNWTITTISVAPGSLGQRTTPILLTYNITTDGTMSTVTEKINGNVVDTKTLSSGQDSVVVLDQTEWDAVGFGKYQRLPVNLLGADGDCEDTSKFTVNTNTTMTLDATKKTKGNNSIRVAKSTGVASSVRPTTPFNPNVGDCYLAIADVYTETTTTNLYLSSYTSGVTVTTKNISPGSAGYPATTLGAWQPIASAYKINTVTTPGSSAFAPQILQEYSSSASYFVDNVRIFKITLAEYNAFTNNQTLAQVQAIADKYNPIGKENTLTVEMGGEVFTYTFDKRLAASDDLISTVRATQDAQITYMTNAKEKLAAAIVGAGGASKNTDTFDQMAAIIKGMANGRKATGTANSGTAYLVTGTPSSYSSYALSVNGLAFTPSLIVIHQTDGLNSRVSMYIKGVDVTTGITGFSEISAPLGNSSSINQSVAQNANFFVTANSFVLPVQYSNTPCTWWAFE